MKKEFCFFKIYNVHFVVGEAQYINDLPALPNETFAAFVLTSVGQGYISDIDPSQALVSKYYSNWAIYALNFK